VTEEWKTGPHQLTYRQSERTFGLVAKALRKDTPDGTPSTALTAALDDLLEASIPPEHKDTSTALAVDWTDVESFSRPPPSGGTCCADPEASWGHRTTGLPGPKGEMFFGYYHSAATMARDETGPPVPELTRRMTLSSCHADPVRAFAPVLARMPGDGIALGDILADSGYAHRDAAAWAIPLRAAGAQLIQDLHPHDRGPQGTHHGAIIANGNLYCPATPKPLLHLGPLPPGATAEQVTACDQQAAELARHKLGRLTTDDADGYHRVTCPAAMGKLRCPLRPQSMAPDRSHPEILTPPEHPPACCTQQTLTVPPDVAAKTRNTTIHRRRTAAPTPAAPAPSGPSPPLRTRLATPSAAAGAASWAWPRPPSGWPACTPSATSASSPPSTPAKPKTTAAPPPASRPEHGNAGEETPRHPHRPAITRPPQPPRSHPAHHHASQATPHAQAQASTTICHRKLQTQDQPRPASQATEISEPNVNKVSTET
jgi:hypothetical protein